MNKIQFSPIRRRQGFTLVELLVVISIIAVLAALVTMIARNALAKSAGSKALLNLRQSGAMLLQHAHENNGRFQFSWSDSRAASSMLPYNIIRRELGLRWGDTGENGKPEICEIMHWNSKKIVPARPEFNCFGVNFTDVRDTSDSGEYIAKWNEEEFSTNEFGGASFNVYSLLLNSVSRLDAYPILMDSSDPKGNEAFRVLSEQNGFVGLRNAGRANAYFLDGSARVLDRKDLKKAGFLKALDNQSKPPKPIKL